MDACSATSSGSATELDAPPESAVDTLLRAASFAAHVHLSDASHTGALKMVRATRAAELLREHGCDNVVVLASALLSGVLDYESTNPRALEDEFGRAVLVTVAQTAESCGKFWSGARLRAHVANAKGITATASSVLAALMAAEFLALIEEPRPDDTFRRLRYFALWLRVLLKRLDCAWPRLRLVMLAMLDAPVLWRGAPRFLRLDALCALHGSAHSALNDYYLARDRGWPLNDTPETSTSETSSSSRFSLARSSTSSCSHTHNNALRSKSLSPLARTRRARRPRTDSAP